jgi:hypothetical protein
LQAEGFSASVAPSLEASDVDALYRAKPSSKMLEVKMWNEALETHVVRYVNVLAVRRSQGGRVFATTDRSFWNADRIIQPLACRDPEGDCLETIREFDGFERTSRTDPKDLSTKETIDLTFEVPPDSSLGLVIGCRQSLLSTYLFYQTLAYMGSSVGHWIAELERGDDMTRKRASGIGQLLGGIEVFVRNKKGNWVRAGEIRETGPLATDVHLLLLPEISPGSTKVRLRLTQGHWRIDFVALALLSEKVEPLRIKPKAVWYDSVPSETARAILYDSTEVLTTFPGDVYTLVYELPEDFTEYELFLESRGYYLEWLREEWLAEENANRAAMMFFDQRDALRQLAPEFKKVEDEIEEMFWNSRYAR